MLVVDGVLIIDKPAGLTSHDVVARVRRLLHVRRVGHAGTLDPFATGVLIVLVGTATRLAQFLTGAEKEYEAVIRLGFSTDTGDLTGRPLTNPDERENLKIRWTDDEIETALRQLCGPINQIPPMYSAKKRKGQKLYELARRGEKIEREPVCVSIHTFEAKRSGGQFWKDNRDGTLDLSVHVVCSAGTYIRTLAEDFGKLLGVDAHLAELRRTRSGDFSVEDAKTLEQLKHTVDEGSLGTVLVPSNAALRRMPFVHLSVRSAERARNGMAIAVESGPSEKWSDGERVRVQDEAGELIAVGYYDARSKLLHPRVVLVSKNKD
jgi:tRNA pseudouridine55 synthase